MTLRGETTMKKQIFGILLALVVMITLVPVAVFAAGTNYDLWVGDELFATGNTVTDPGTGTAMNVTWNSDNPAVAAVESNGKLTAVAAGSATITATAADSTVVSTYTVTVKKAVAKVGATKYETIDAALSNWTAGTTLTLLDNVTLSAPVVLKSTEHHILDLGTYTLTAASGKNAIEITCNGRSSASYCLTINADAQNPGGITATGKACVYYRKTVSTKDRPIITFNGGVFNGSYSVNSYSSNKGTNCPQYVFNGGTFNGNVSLSNAMMRVFGGTFHGWINCTGDSSAYRLIAGGTFKSFQFMTADNNNTKFWIGTKMGVSDVGAYVDDNGYLVVGGPVISAPGTDYEASVDVNKGASQFNNFHYYLKYSSTATNGLYYTDVYTALADNNKTTGRVTVYTDSLDLTALNYKGTILPFNAPDGFPITFAAGTVPAWTVDFGAGKVFYKEAVAGAAVTRTYKPVDVTLPTAKTGLSYNGAAQALINGATVTTAGYTAQYAIGTDPAVAPATGWSSEIPAVTKAGTYYVWFKLAAADGDYVHEGTQCLAVTVAKVDGQFSAAPAAKTGLVYTGEAQALVSAGAAVGGTVQYKLDNGTYSEIIPAVTNAGTYTVWYKVVGDESHNDVAEASVSVTVEQAELTIEANTLTAFIGSEMPSLAYTVEGLIGNDTLIAEPVLSTAAVMYIAGQYDIVPHSANAGSNYTINYVNGTLYLIDYTAIMGTAHKIECAGDTDGGDVSVNKRTAYRNTPITIQVTPDAGYWMTMLAVTDSYGNAIDVTVVSETQYTFKMPSADVKVEVTFAAINTTCSKDNTCVLFGYTDLDTKGWYHDGIHFCLENGLMNGVGENTFDPEGASTRAMIVTALWRLAGSPVVNYAMNFEDVEADQWYTEAIRWAASEKIVEGLGDGTFGTEKAVTREELAVILYRYEQSQGGGFKGLWAYRMDYADLADLSDWAYEAMAWMNMNGVVNGRLDNTLAPQDGANRAEAAAMLQRFAKVMSKGN